MSSSAGPLTVRGSPSPRGSFRLHLSPAAAIAALLHTPADASASASGADADADDAPLVFWCRALRLSMAGVAVGVGALYVAPSLSRAVYYLRWDFPVPAPLSVTRYLGFTHGVLACVTAGWTMLVAQLAGPAGPLRRRDGHAYDAVATSIVTWALLDNTMSAASGVWGNVALNAVCLAVFALPMWKLRPHMRWGAEKTATE